MSDIYKRIAQDRKKSQIKLTALAVCMLMLSLLSAMMFLSIGEDKPDKENPPSEPILEYSGLQIAYNTTELSRSRKDIKYIVIHDTANTSKTATAYNHYLFFNTGNRKSSADFFVDDTDILQVNDYYRYYTWHCGDGRGSKGIKNSNSIGIEICVNSGGDYSMALANAASLTQELMQELDIDISHIVRHKDASGKDCPQSMSEWEWVKFKRELIGK